MNLTALCTMQLQYSGDFHLARPYGNESGIGWGTGVGTVTGDRLAGTARWSNQPSRRGDGSMLPNARGIVATSDGAEVFFDLTGRTVFLERAAGTVGRQLLTVMFESEDPQYSWLNQAVCVGDGAVDPIALTARIEVFELGSEI